MNKVIRNTRSVCPVCLKNLPAVLTAGEGGSRWLEKTCPEHGHFRVCVWQGRMDFEEWIGTAAPLAPGMGSTCPGNCGICPEHEMDSCCVLLEVTARCNLRCRFCFADGGGDSPDPDTETLKEIIREIAQTRDGPLLQFSGGEPTLRRDLPELIRWAKEAGCRTTQLNTNGIRLAEDPAYAEELARAGLDIVFLQFDGTRESVYETLRGRPLLQTKLEAIRICGQLGLGVTLVPTVVPGVNQDQLGELVALARELVPTVRGIHFQPVSYFGRIPGAPGETRYTLDALMADLCSQAGIPEESLLPSRCDHPLCGFHAGYLVTPEGGLKPLATRTPGERTQGSARDNRAYVTRHWKGVSPEAAPGPFAQEMDFDTFLYYMRQRRLTLSAMAFQDAGNLNIERLHRCSLHVWNNGAVKPFCANYLTPL